MAKALKTTVKRRNLLTGTEGKKFTSTSQPPPENKKAGWEQWRRERHLTQEIIKLLGEGSNLKTYVKSIHTLAKKGNPKAIDVINKCLEDDIIKFAQTDTEGNDILFKLDERFKTS